MGYLKINALPKFTNGTTWRIWTTQWADREWLNPILLVALLAAAVIAFLRPYGALLSAGIFAGVMILDYWRKQRDPLGLLFFLAWIGESLSMGYLIGSLMAPP